MIQQRLANPLATALLEQKVREGDVVESTLTDRVHVQPGPQCREKVNFREGCGSGQRGLPRCPVPCLYAEILLAAGVGRTAYSGIKGDVPPGHVDAAVGIELGCSYRGA